MKENRSQQCDRCREAYPEQAHQQYARGPFDPIPGKRSDGMLAADGEAEMEVLRTGWIDGLQGGTRTAIEKLQPAGIIKARCTQAQSRSPQEEIDNISNAAAQHRQSLEEQGYRTSEKHSGHRKKDKRRPECPQRERVPFRTKQLHDDRGQHEHYDHAGEDREITERLRNGIEILA